MINIIINFVLEHFMDQMEQIDSIGLIYEEDEEETILLDDSSGIYIDEVTSNYWVKMGDDGQYGLYVKEVDKAYLSPTEINDFLNDLHSSGKLNEMPVLPDKVLVFKLKKLDQLTPQQFNEICDILKRKLMLNIDYHEERHLHFCSVYDLINTIQRYAK